MPYATNADLAGYMGVDITTLPANAVTMLSRASEMMDEVTMDRIKYGLTNDPSFDYATAAKNATCAQVEYWIFTGELEKFGVGDSVTLGPLSVSGKIPKIAPRARRHLFLAGLLWRGAGSLPGTGNRELARQFYRSPNNPTY